MTRRRLFLRNVTTAYPGTLGAPTDKGIQDVKPLPLEAPTESYEIMLLRWQTGVFEVGASEPNPPPDPIIPVIGPFTILEEGFVMTENLEMVDV